MDKQGELVSVIIPTYNRFKSLLETIKSIKNQTYKNIEIIVVNDHSSENDYYSHDWSKENVKIIQLLKGTKEIYNHSAPGIVRNHGIKIASGEYIAFCDDDDMWLPSKVELQLQALKKTDCKISCTEAYAVGENFDYKLCLENTHQKYLTEVFMIAHKNIFIQQNSNILDNGYPEIWNLDLIKVHNCFICSSVMVEKTMLDKIGLFNSDTMGEDYHLWLKILEHTDCAFIEQPCVYYDLTHGKSRN